MSDVAALRYLEESLWRSPTRYDREYMDRVLSPEFTELGRSGRAYTREEVLSSPAGDIRATLSDMHVRMLSKDIALVTYRSEVAYDNVELANRASVWRRTDHGWLLEFHQGTPHRSQEP